jgi:hypothetical protein
LLLLRNVQTPCTMTSRNLGFVPRLFGAAVVLSTTPEGGEPDRDCR